MNIHNTNIRNKKTNITLRYLISLLIIFPLLLSSCRFVEVNPTETVVTPSSDAVVGNIETADSTVTGDENTEIADSTVTGDENAEIADSTVSGDENAEIAEQTDSFSYNLVPAYSGQPYAIINGNQPYFADTEMVTTPFEYYSDLDSLGRCGVAYANICIELMPTEERGAIGMVRPSGWQTVKYDFIDGKYLYNRCHLIGYQLAGENANVKNLITGTRYLNVVGMLPFENQVTNYVTRTDNHVLYRVTPIYVGNNLVAQGVLMEAKSVEDAGEGICFNVFCYNVQPGVVITYADGSNYSDGSLENAVPLDSMSSSPSASDTSAADMAQSTADSSNETTSQPAGDSSMLQSTTTTSTGATDAGNMNVTYVLNTNTGKFHYPSCSSVDEMSPRNRQEVDWTREDCINAGYEPCGRCHP